MRLLKPLILSVFLAALAACGTTVSLDEPTNAPGGAGTSGSAAGTGGAAVTPVAQDPFNPQSPLAQQRSVYFEFDSYVVPEQYRSLVEMHASYLRGNKQQTIRIEGNADARGGSEYNLALGQRRSDAVARMLTLLGVNADQIEAISFGKERLRALGNTEADHAENRRADIVYRR